MQLMYRFTVSLSLCHSLFLALSQGPRWPLVLVPVGRDGRAVGDLKFAVGEEVSKVLTSAVRNDES